MMQQQVMQQQMQAFQQELYTEAIDEIRGDMQGLADIMGYTYIVEENAMFFGADDITAEVVDYVQRELEE